MNQSQQTTWSYQHQQHQVPQSVPTPPQPRNGPLRFLQTPRAFLRSVVQRMGQERPPQEYRATSWASQQPQPPQVVSRAESPATEVQYDRSTPLAPQLFRDSWTHQDSPQVSHRQQEAPTVYFQERAIQGFIHQAGGQQAGSSPPGPTVINGWSLQQSQQPSPSTRQSVQITQLPSSIEGSQHSSSSTEHSPTPAEVPVQVEGSLMGIKAHSVNESPAVVPSPRSALQNEGKRTPETIATPQRKVDKVPSPPQTQGEPPGTSRDSQAPSDQPRDPSVTTGSKGHPSISTVSSGSSTTMHIVPQPPMTPDGTTMQELQSEIRDVREASRTYHTASQLANDSLHRKISAEIQEGLAGVQYQHQQHLASLMENQKVENEQRNAAVTEADLKQKALISEMSQAMMRDVKKLIAETLSPAPNPVPQTKPPPTDPLPVPETVVTDHSLVQGSLDHEDIDPEAPTMVNGKVPGKRMTLADAQAATWKAKNYYRDRTPTGFKMTPSSHPKNDRLWDHH